MKLPIFIRARWKWLKRQPFENWAVLLTSFYLSLFLLILLARWVELFSLPLNELGDFAAGVFAPLAFLWLVLGYKQQGRELANSNAALSMQAEELRSLVENQKVANDNYERSTEPLLSLNHVGEIDTDTGPVDRFEISNQGGHCKRLKLKIYGEKLPDTLEYLGELASGAARMFSSHSSLESSQFYRFSFSYESLGGKQIFKEIVGLRYEGATAPGFNLIVDYEALPRNILEALGL